MIITIVIKHMHKTDILVIFITFQQQFHSHIGLKEHITNTHRLKHNIITNL